mgnify:CR=1 FL=1
MTLYIVQPAVQLCHGARRDAVLPVQNQRQRVARQIGQGGVVLAHSQMQYRLAGGKIAKQLAGHLVVIGVAQADKHVGAVFQRGGLVGRQQAGTHKFCAQNTGCLVGVGGKAMVMLSGGIDSPIASYLTMKRGVAIECVHYASPPYTSAQAREKVLELARLLAPYQGHIMVHIVPFTDLQLAIYEHCDESYAITIMRRMMYRIAEKLARKQNALAIVNGESIGQVASQTLESMMTINAVTRMPVIRPVACMDKVEIIDLARKINTYETSIQPWEDCCTIFTPKNPVTKPTIRRAEWMESHFDFEPMVDACVENCESLLIYPDKKEDDTEDLF